MKSEFKVELTAIKKELRVYNKHASQFYKHSLTYKSAYRALQKSSIWTTAKELLLRYTLLTKGRIICFLCEKPLNSNNATLHHKKYKHTKIFDPKYITFVHRVCHTKYHRQHGNPKRFSVFISFHGMRIYTKFGRIKIPIWCFLSIVGFSILFLLQLLFLLSN